MIHKDDHSILEIPEYKDSAEVLFNTSYALSFN